MDSLDAIVITVIDDGESETAPLAGNLLSNVFINPDLAYL
ncbi:hypothetical protein L0O77_07145 [Enterococcus avium]|nr:hypothetical protein [Enterococcus avium]